MPSDPLAGHCFSGYRVNDTPVIMRELARRMPGPIAERGYSQIGAKLDLPAGDLLDLPTQPAQ